MSARRAKANLSIDLGPSHDNLLFVCALLDGCERHTYDLRRALSTKFISYLLASYEECTCWARTEETIDVFVGICEWVQFILQEVCDAAIVRPTKSVGRYSTLFVPCHDVGS
jgi:hypothetical protein